MLGQNPAVATKAEKTFADREKSMMCNRDKLREHKTAMRFEFSVATKPEQATLRLRLA
jgi:hypothetical protein